MVCSRACNSPKLHYNLDIPNVRYALLRLQMANTESTIAAILSAAETLFVEKTYADVSMRNIADAAEVSTGALYHHFPSKENLYYAMLTAYMERVKQATVEATPLDGSCRERLRALTRVYLALPPLQRNVMRLVRRDLNAFNGEMRQGIVRAYQEAVPDLVEQVLTDAIHKNELKPQDARWLAWTFVAIVETILSEYAQTHLGNMNVRLDAALDLFLEGAGL
jgi:AcrR family transcriptional regulator